MLIASRYRFKMFDNQCNKYTQWLSACHHPPEAERIDFFLFCFQQERIVSARNNEKIKNFIKAQDKKGRCDWYTCFFFVLSLLLFRFFVQILFCVRCRVRSSIGSIISQFFSFHLVSLIFNKKIWVLMVGIKFYVNAMAVLFSWCNRWMRFV